MGSTLPGRVYAVWNMATPSRAVARTRVAVDRSRDRLTCAAGTGWLKKRMPVAERHWETARALCRPPSGAKRVDNQPDTRGFGTRKGADVSQVSRGRTKNVTGGVVGDVGR